MQEPEPSPPVPPPAASPLLADIVTVSGLEQNQEQRQSTPSAQSTPRDPNRAKRDAVIATALQRLSEHRPHSCELKELAASDTKTPIHFFEVTPYGKHLLSLEEQNALKRRRRTLVACANCTILGYNGAGHITKHNCDLHRPTYTGTQHPWYEWQQQQLAATNPAVPATTAATAGAQNFSLLLGAAPPRPIPATPAVAVPPPMVVPPVVEPAYNWLPFATFQLQHIFNSILPCIVPAQHHAYLKILLESNSAALSALYRSQTPTLSSAPAPSSGDGLNAFNNADNPQAMEVQPNQGTLGEVGMGNASGRSFADNDDSMADTGTGPCDQQIVNMEHEPSVAPMPSTQHCQAATLQADVEHSTVQPSTSVHGAPERVVQTALEHPLASLHPATGITTPQLHTAPEHSVVPMQAAAEHTLATLHAPPEPQPIISLQHLHEMPSQVELQQQMVTIPDQATVLQHVMGDQVMGDQVQSLVQPMNLQEHVINTQNQMVGIQEHIVSMQNHVSLQNPLVPLGAVGHQDHYVSVPSIATPALPSTTPVMLDTEHDITKPVLPIPTPDAFHGDL